MARAVRSGYITKGPSKWDLMLAFFDGNADNRRTITFRVANTGEGIELVLIINELVRDGGSGEYWLFKGVVETTGDDRMVSGWFRTDTRRGYLSLN